MPNQITFLTIKHVTKKLTLSESTIYRRIAKGVFPPSVNMGEKAQRFIAHEVEAIARALCQGESPAQIRALVTRLVTERQNAGTTP